jgi:hypothetical protein
MQEQPEETDPDQKAGEHKDIPRIPDPTRISTRRVWPIQPTRPSRGPAPSEETGNPGQEC